MVETAHSNGPTPVQAKTLDGQGVANDTQSEPATNELALSIGLPEIIAYLEDAGKLQLP